ncbi:MAG: DUF5817 domain-containing protein [Haloarculaceae archaeon]
MYAVVGCSDCQALWVVAGRPERSKCPQCGATRLHEKRKKFVTTDDPDHAREVRAALLAERRGQADAFERVDSFAELETALDDAGVGDDEYLEAAGVDVDEVAAAADRASGGGASQSRREIVEAALRELDAPTEDDVIEYATERGVPAGYVGDALEKLVRDGRVSEHRGTYRLL